MTKLNLNLNAITIGAGYTDKDSQKDGYPQFEDAIKARFDSMVQSGVKLFKTDATGIYDLFLSNLPAYSQQHYNCNACRHFFDRFGGLVTIDEKGDIHSVLWDEKSAPTFFVNAVNAIKINVLTSKVTGVFLSEEKTLGYPKTGVWTHPHAKLPSSMVFRSRNESAGQAMAKKQQEFGMVIRALRDFSMDTVDKALALINSETLYRGDKAKPNVEWFKGLLESLQHVNNSKRYSNLVWLAVASASEGFTHIRSSSTGVLLKAITEGLPTEEIQSKFYDIMNPANYQRSQSAPSDKAIYEAEKLIVNMGLEESLERRYAKFEEVPLAWKPEAETKVEPKKPTGGVFGHLMAKAKTENIMSLPTSVMTWDKFCRTVLPTADGLEVLVDNPSKFMALVTAVNPEAENILQWNNPFSWYYHAGIDAEMKRRVEEAGGRYEDNELRVSLMWEGLTDLDLHCVTPLGEEIHFHNKRGRCDGYLDLDMNGLDKQSTTPVENIRWHRNAPQGRYKFFVHNYNEKVDILGTPFKAELEVNGQVFSYEGQALREKGRVTVFEFNYVKGQTPVIDSPQTTSSSNWNVREGSFVKVNGITTSPNLWGGEENHHAGTHVFFLLEGVKDLSEGKGRGFFNEMLKPELRQIRKTLELFTANTPIEDAEEATACGVGYSKDGDWGLTLKVTSGNSSRVIKIDRWD